jgi:hypothetical protein
VAVMSVPVTWRIRKRREMPNFSDEQSSIFMPGFRRGNAKKY